MPKNNRILIIGNGGIAKKNQNIALANNDVGNFILDLKKKGYCVRYCDRIGAAQVDSFLYTFDLKKNNIKYSIISGRRPKSYFHLLKLTFFILTNAHIYIYYPGGISKWAPRICLFFGKKYQVYVRGYGLYVPDKSRKAEIDNDFNDTLILNKATSLITVSPIMQKDLQKTNERVYLIKPMLYWDLHDIFNRRSDAFHQTDWNFLFVGTVDERKGILELIEVARILKQKGLKFRINVAGDGELLEYLFEQERKNNASSDIYFLGSIYDKLEMARIYEKSHALLLLSRNEGFPRVLYEAMIKSLPIFTTMISGVAGTLIPDYNCIELPIRDPNGQAQAILNAIKRPELMKYIAETGQKTVIDILKTRTPHYQVLIDCITNAIVSL
ncbi:hypothetical protein ES708_18840 [subsurface metagenome]